jgi:hypothetical protein
VIVVDVLPDGNLSLITDGFVRLIAKSLIEYKESRIKIIKFFVDGYSVINGPFHTPPQQS